MCFLRIINNNENIQIRLYVTKQLASRIVLRFYIHLVMCSNNPYYN